MASTIDPTVPIQGNPTTQSVRDNFLASRDEITALQDASTATDGEVATNAANIATNVADISANAAAIVSNDADIATNVTNIATNANNILDHATEITDLQDVTTDPTSGNAALDTRVTANEGDITTIQGEQATQNTNISVNTQNIASNTTAINDLVVGAGTVPSNRRVTAGEGLTGGGPLTTDITLNMAVTGGELTLTADNLTTNTASPRLVDHGSVNITAGSGLSGGGNLEATRTLTVGEGTGITVNATDVALNVAYTDARYLAIDAQAADSALLQGNDTDYFADAALLTRGLVPPARINGDYSLCNAGKVDGFSFVYGSTGTDNNTFYFMPE